MRIFGIQLTPDDDDLKDDDVDTGGDDDDLDPDPADPVDDEHDRYSPLSARTAIDIADGPAAAGPPRAVVPATRFVSASSAGGTASAAKKPGLLAMLGLRASPPADVPVPAAQQPPPEDETPGGDVADRPPAEADGPDAETDAGVAQVADADVEDAEIEVAQVADAGGEDAETAAVEAPDVETDEAPADVETGDAPAAVDITDAPTGDSDAAVPAPDTEQSDVIVPPAQEATPKPKKKTGKPRKTKAAPAHSPAAPSAETDTDDAQDAAADDRIEAASHEDLKTLFPEVEWREPPAVDPVRTEPVAAGESADVDADPATEPAAAREPAGMDEETADAASQDDPDGDTPESIAPDDGTADGVPEETVHDPTQVSAGASTPADADVEAVPHPSLDAAPSPTPAVDDERTNTRSDGRTRLRLGVLALAVAAVVAAVAVPTLPTWTGDDAIVAEAPQNPAESAIAWLDANADRSDRVAVAPALRDGLVAAGWQPADVSSRETGAALPPGIAWVVTAASDTVVEPDSVVVASFGDGAATAVVRAVVPGGADAYRAAEPDRAAERAQYGSELAENPAVVMTAADRALLTDGAVDRRILLVLGALSSAGPVVVGGLPVVDGEADAPRRSVVLRTVGEQPLVDDSELTAAGIALVQALADDYSPATASFEDDSLTLRYPLTLDPTTEETP